MLVISAGMPKSGTAYVYNIINDLMVASGSKDAREIKSRHGLEDILKWHNNNLAHFRATHLIRLICVSLVDGDFVIKSHSGPTRVIRFLLRLGLVKLIYVYRDPRDVLVSAIDHGKKLLVAGENHTFARMVDFGKALTNVRKWVNIWEKYAAIGGILQVRYRDLLTNPTATVDRITSYLGLSVDPQEVQQILWKYNKDNQSANMTGLHFNKAKIGRYKEELTISQQRMIDEVLGMQIARMGYALSDSPSPTGKQYKKIK